jgi:DNA-binding MarR family transcriptional regulator
MAINPTTLALEPTNDDTNFDRVLVTETSLPHAFTVMSNRTSRLLESMYSGEFGLTVIGWRIMGILGSRAPVSAKLLAELTAMDAVRISREIEQLRKKKYVSRRTDPVDRRRSLLKLSKKGEEVYNAILPLFHASEAAVLSVISPDDVKTLRRIMKVLVERSASVVNEDTDWREILAKFGSAPDAPSSPDAPPNNVMQIPAKL